MNDSFFLTVQAKGDPIISCQRRKQVAYYNWSFSHLHRGHEEWCLISNWVFFSEMNAQMKDYLDKGFSNKIFIYSETSIESALSWSSNYVSITETTMQGMYGHIKPQIKVKCCLVTEFHSYYICKTCSAYLKTRLHLSTSAINKCVLQ